MQVWTVASGKTAVIASGKPFRPSTTAISTSSTPRFLSSVMTRSQNLAPFGLLDPQPQDLLGAVGPNAERDMDRLVADQGLVADLHPQRVKEDQRVDRLERAGLPGGDLVQDGIRDRADQVGRDLDAIQLAQVPDDLAGAHAPGVHRDHLVVEAGEAALILGDQLRIEAGLAIARDLQVQLAGVGHHRLAAIAVAAVAGPSFAREMVIHLGIQGCARRAPSSGRREGRSDQRPSWDRPQPTAGPGWHQEYEALCVSAWLGSFPPIMPAYTRNSG